MQLKQTTDYSIRVLLYLAAHRRSTPVPGSEIARATGITPAYFRKVATVLREKELLRSDQGSQGGFSLNYEPERITLYQIIAACEGAVILNRCLEDPESCSRDAAAWCKVRNYLDRVQNTLNGELESVTLADLL